VAQSTESVRPLRVLPARTSSSTRIRVHLRTGLGHLLLLLGDGRQRYVKFPKSL
jgi:hypothetical protein